ncbi:hypothetical protein HW555_005891, partial [Spodoptera exigua]
LILLEIATARPNAPTYTNRNTRERYSSNSRDNRESPKQNSLDNIVLAIDTGVKNYMAGKTKPDIVDNIAKKVMEFVNNNGKPVFKAGGQDYNINPEIIHFRKDKPSVVFEINSKSIINALKDLLQSKTTLKFMDQISKEAAVVYRSVKTELDKPQVEKMSNRQYYNN